MPKNWKIPGSESHQAVVDDVSMSVCSARGGLHIQLRIVVTVQTLAWVLFVSSMCIFMSLVEHEERATRLRRL